MYMGEAYRGIITFGLVIAGHSRNAIGLSRQRRRLAGNRFYRQQLIGGQGHSLHLMHHHNSMHKLLQNEK
jgi:hypothetical protein